MVFKDLEGTMQARKELAEKESKILLSLQGGKTPKPKPKPKLIDMINMSFEDYVQFHTMYENHPFMVTDADDDLLGYDGVTMPKFTLYKPTETTELKTLLENNTDKLASYIPTVGPKTPAYLEFKKKMSKLQKRKLLKKLIQKHGTKPVDLSLVDNVLNDELVDDMILICLKLDHEQSQQNNPMPDFDPFKQFGY